MKAQMLQLLPHLQIITESNGMKNIFSRTHNIGYVQGDTFFVKEEFFTGGAKNSVFTDQDIKMVVETLRLKHACTEAIHIAEENKVKRVLDILKEIKTAKLLGEVQNLALQAVEAGEKMNDSRVVEALKEVQAILEAKTAEENNPDKKEEPKAEENKAEETEEKDGKKKPTVKQPKAGKKKSAKKKAAKKNKKNK